MKFLVDAQLPRCLCIWLRQQGHDAVHTLDLDQSFLLRNTPHRLLLISSGNVGNAELERLLAVALPEIVDAFDRARYVELSKNSLIIHE